jgi:nucleoside 2-deoxyribosyltransferase
MPFDGAFDDLHRRAIKPALAAFGLGAERYDDIPKTGSVLEEMRHSIDRARLVIAVVTGKNPHVFLELGLTLARGKPCILLAGSAGDVPDFLEQLPHVVYGTSSEAALKGLTERIAALVDRAPARTASLDQS